tara:strand:- start:7 stop:294 length:288 start_codon:yes stop_codon:yes gene_type:complete
MTNMSLKKMLYINPMNVNNIPNHVKRILQDKELSMEKKMQAFMAFMPKLPGDPKNDQVWEDNEKVGETIKKMIDEGKLSINGLDERARLRIVQEP